MSTRRKIALGVVTAWPLVYMAGFFAWLAIQFTTDGPMELFTTMLVLHGITMLLGIALIVFYAIHASNSDRLASDERTLWIILVIVVNAFAQPVYWFLYIWRDERVRSRGHGTAGVPSLR